jgi:hypothetical protein
MTKQEHVADLAGRKAWTDAWREVLAFAAGQMDDATPLLEELGDPRKDDLFGHLRAVALRCLAEVSRTWLERHEPLVNRLTQDCFDLYWHHLRQGTLAAVGDLTAALPALGRANGRWAAPSTTQRTALVEALRTLLAHPEGAVRSRAADALGALGAAVARPEVLDALLERLDDAEGEVQSSAAYVLGRLGAAAARPEVLAALVERLDDPEGEVRFHAAKALARLGAAAARPEVLDALVERLTHPEMEVRFHAVEALGRLGASTARPEVLTALVERLTHPEMEVRFSAAEALGSLGATEVRVFAAGNGGYTARSVRQLSAPVHQS